MPCSNFWSKNDDVDRDVETQNYNWDKSLSLSFGVGVDWGNYTMYVVGFVITGSNKAPLIENLALAFERTEWQFQSDPIWTAELEAYERKVSTVTGRSSYNAPEGIHDDTVIARSLMIWQATNGTGTVMKQARVAGRGGPAMIRRGHRRRA